MTQSSGNFDPSMDEILSSIRRIISDDKKKSGLEDILELRDPVQDGGVFSGSGSTSTGPLMSQKAQSDSVQALNALLDHKSNQSQPVSGFSGSGKTLESFISDLVRPLLKEWLDANLPDLIRRIVQTEVGELIRKRGS